MEKTPVKKRITRLDELQKKRDTIKIAHSLKGNYTEILYHDNSKELICRSMQKIIEIAPHLVQLRKAYYCSPLVLKEYQHLASRRHKTTIKNLINQPPKQSK